METVAVTATFHYTACLLIDNLDFAFVNHIFDILFKKGVSLEKLSDSVDTFSLHCIILHKLILALLTLGKIFDMFCFRKLRCDVRKHEELRIAGLAGKLVNTLVGKLDATVFLINNEIQRIGHLWHLTLVVLKVICFCFKHEILHSLLREELDERAVLWQTFERTVEQQCPFLLCLLIV